MRVTDADLHNVHGHVCEGARNNVNNVEICKFGERSFVCRLLGPGLRTTARFCSRGMSSCVSDTDGVAYCMGSK